MQPTLGPCFHRGPIEVRRRAPLLLAVGAVVRLLNRPLPLPPPSAAGNLDDETPVSMAPAATSNLAVVLSWAN